ncbi:MAG: RdgB/HAM1 family non-canonical purine NTP pyrophosphatase [Clostridia bacterium]|nr:RdgB/HAM1 family non-canonical purine NTP pyrophosphatase [Clostridia bacterium]
MNKNIILASNNKHKIQEIKAKLRVLNIDVLSQSESGCNIDVEENGTTFAENAAIKAKALYEILKKPVIADDSGLEVDYLDGAPGVYSARFCGPDATDKDKYNKILELLKDVNDIKKRAARFKCVICYIDEQGKEHFFEGVCEGRISFEPKGDSNFGYDPIFLVGDRTFAEMSEEEKNKISHRGLAIDKLFKYLKKQ